MLLIAGTLVDGSSLNDGGVVEAAWHCAGELRTLSRTCPQLCPSLGQISNPTKNCIAVNSPDFIHLPGAGSRKSSTSEYTPAERLADGKQEGDANVA